MKHAIVQDDYVAICFIIIVAHMNILFIMAFKVFELIKWSYCPPPKKKQLKNHVDCSAWDGQHTLSMQFNIF